MTEAYDRFIELVEAEYDALPAIRFLDDYQHFEAQLRQMRKRSVSGYQQHRFAMEIAVLFSLWDYDDAVGLPRSAMPSGDDAEDAERWKPEFMDVNSNHEDGADGQFLK